MKQLLRILLAAVGILAVVAVAAVVYVTTFLDPEDFKPRLTEVVEEQTGLNLSLDGALNWSFYPRIGMSVEKARAWLPEQSTDNPAFASIDRAEVSVAFAPLLRGEIAVDGLTLDGMRLNLKRNQEGEGNWETLLDRLAKDSEQAERVLAPASAGPHAEAGSLNVVLNIANVQMRNANIYYQDAQVGDLWLLEKLNITGSNVNPLRSFPLKATFALKRYKSPNAATLEREPDFTSDVTLDTRMKLALADQRFVLENAQLATRNRFVSQGEPQQIDFSAAELSARLESKQLSITDGTINATLRHADNWDGGLALNLAFGLDSDWGAQAAELKALELSGPNGLRVQGNLTLSKLLAAPQYQGQLTVSSFNLRPWLARAGIALTTRHEDALSDVALTSPVEGDLQQVALPNLSLVVDDTTLTGELSAALDGSALAFDLEGDTLNLDRYLPADEALAQASRGFFRKALADDADGLLPQAWLSTLTLDAALRLETFILSGLTFDAPTLTLEGSEGEHRLSAFESGFYGGELSATGRLDSRETPMAWAFQPRVVNVDVAPLVEAFSEDTSPIRGQLNVDGELTTRGNAREVLVRQLNGELDAALNNGAILDINISKEMCEMAATFEGESTRRDWHSDTRFDRFDATLVFRDGIVESDDLLITLPGIDVRGEGAFDLGSQRFDVLTNARVVNTADAACEVNPRLEKVALPMRCEGHVSDARSEWCRFDREAFQTNMSELLSDEVGRRVEDALEGSFERLDERLGEETTRELRDGLRRLFN
ncbi:AsmA family protein [Halomonas vilamensis]|uniref:AsmA family protein n=1 Tax=Vreelandella vilamensis TaxID=531309 RepID=A0ABU1H6Q8_9GAMM|nr:AsmA family protein [Halomonas vilamensis]MDR5899971.1 AsmA family protein [Halomonas vilamensis]